MKIVLLVVTLLSWAFAFWLAVRIYKWLKKCFFRSQAAHKNLQLFLSSHGISWASIRDLAVKTVNVCKVGWQRARETYSKLQLWYKNRSVSNT